MSTRRPEEYMIWAFVLMVAVFLVALIVSSGILLWAIAIGVAAAVAVYLVTRELASALSWGLSTAMCVLMLGAMSVLSPGWYQSLLW